VASNERIEFGDFQTPAPLARAVCSLLRRLEVPARTIVEPACGVGVFLEEALQAYPAAERLAGFDINTTYVQETRRRFPPAGNGRQVTVQQADFFAVDWSDRLRTMSEPLLVIGNPPWVTNAGLSRLGSRNVPRKMNADRLRGLDALTGKSNFDVSQWLLDRLIEALADRQATLAMLCKTRVARAVLQRAWNRDGAPHRAHLYRIDAARHFGAAVDACLLICRFLPGATRSRSCSTHADLESGASTRPFGIVAGRVVQDPQQFQQLQYLVGTGTHRWRSGVKHDCVRVLELRIQDGHLTNGFGQRVDVEETYLYPLLKGSRLARGETEPRHWVILPQAALGEDPVLLRERAPHTWRYLECHAANLDRRASVIYRGRPRFSVFGVGSYTFAPWKVAVAGFAKELGFHQLGPWQDKPIVLDDTSYFLPCENESLADELLTRVNHALARQFYSCLIFWDNKRPITAEILQTLDLDRLAREETHAPRQCLVG
jgi:hypothetical protein